MASLFDRHFSNTHFHWCLNGLKEQFGYFKDVTSENVGCIRKPLIGFSRYRHNSFHQSKKTYFYFDGKGNDQSHVYDVSNDSIYINVFKFHLLYEAQNLELCKTFQESLKFSLCCQRLCQLDYDQKLQIG